MHAHDSDKPPDLPVTVVGIGADGWAGLTEPARAALRAALVIAGSPRQLDLLPDLNARRVPLPAPLLPQLDALVRDNPGLCVLASGDPTLHGIGATLARRLGAGRLRILPTVSSVALACACLGWPQQDIAVVSLVSQPPEAVLASLQPGAQVIALCRDRHTPAQVAAVLAASGWGPSELIVMEQLGGPSERVRAAQPACGDVAVASSADLCVLAITARPSPAVAAATRAPGLPDHAYESDGQITRREVRAPALAALRPGPGVLWDVGAGSGSIGIEWMRCDPRSRAIAIEARPDRAARITRNATALGVPGLQVVTGTAPAAFARLPEPDAIFIGGGLTAAGVLDTCWERLPARGRMVAHAVTIESEALLHEWHRARGGDLVKIAVSYLDPLGTFTTWRPALPVTQWQVTRS